jgi:hypothetical protein
MTWKRLSKIVAIQSSSYYAKPLLIPTHDGYEIIFTDRDSNNCSFIKRGKFLIKNAVGEITREKILYQKDQSNPLEANGVIASSFLIQDQEILLFCTAFHFDHKKNFLSSPFLLILDKKTFVIKSKSALRLQNNDIPTGCGGALRENGINYLTFESRFQKNDTFSFELKLATSLDIQRWDVSKTFSIMPKEDEQYLSSPIFLKHNNRFIIAYSLKKNGRYSILFTESNNLIDWNSISEMSFLPNPEVDWENEEVCYPFLWVNEKNEICMLYNGNKYGKSGLGMAIWN